MCKSRYPENKPQNPEVRTGSLNCDPTHIWDPKRIYLTGQDGEAHYARFSNTVAHTFEGNFLHQFLHEYGICYMHKF